MKRETENDDDPRKTKPDYLVISHAAAELGIPAPTLRRYCDMNMIVAKRASDGTRLFSPESIEAAREWLTNRPETPATGHGTQGG